MTLSTDQATNLGKGLLYGSAINAKFTNGVIRGQILTIANAQTLPDCVWATTGAPGAAAGGNVVVVDSATTKIIIGVSVPVGVAILGIIFVIILATILYLAYRRRKRAKEQVCLLFRLLTTLDTHW